VVFSAHLVPADVTGTPSARKNRWPPFCGSLRSRVGPQEFSSKFRMFADGLWRQAGWRRLLVVAIAGLGLVELGFQIHFSRAAPTLDEWRALTAEVKQMAAPGALVVVAPEWAEPNARLALGTALMPIGHVARPDETAFERALEIGMLGEEAPALRGWQLEREQRHGKFLLRAYTNPNVVPVLYDFLAQLQPPSAAVRVLRKEGAEVCPFGNAKVSNGDLGGHPTYPRRRFSCPGAEWSMVGLTVIEDQNYRPRQCIWAHPSPRGTLELHFEAVPLGNVISGHGGLPYLFEREWRGTPVELDVLVAGQLIGTFTHEDGEGWKGFELSTREHAGRTESVDFRVRSRSIRDRQFCFQASVR
jgi:hypothetical protein